MARLKRGIGSMLSGSAGGMVFVQMNGETYMRVSPERSKSSWTPRQALHRKRFRELINFSSQFKFSLIVPIWNLMAKKMSGHALFVKANMPAFGLDGSLSDPKLLQFSTGKLPLPQQFKAVRQGVDSTAISVSWNNDPYLDPSRLSDQLMVISGEGGQFSYLTHTGLLRSSVNGSFELPVQPASASFIYLFFASENNTEFTGSVCFEV